MPPERAGEHAVVGKAAVQAYLRMDKRSNHMVSQPTQRVLQ